MDQQEELGRNIERMGQHLIGLLGLDDEEEVPQEQVSEEERLTILRMLEQKKISLEEAEQLLSALEGK